MDVVTAFADLFVILACVFAVAWAIANLADLIVRWDYERMSTRRLPYWRRYPKGLTA